MKNVLLIVGVCLLVLGSIWIGLYVNYSNQERSIVNLASAQEQANTAIFDKVWKVISQKAQVSEKYKNSFEQIYTKIMSARYSAKDGSLMKWIQEQNPNFDSSIYTNLMDTIQGQREEFAQVQIKLRDIKREHDNLRTLFPSSLFVGRRAELKVTIVTSEATAEVFKTGKENNVKVF